MTTAKTGPIRFLIILKQYKGAAASTSPHRRRGAIVGLSGRGKGFDSRTLRPVRSSIVDSLHYTRGRPRIPTGEVWDGSETIKKNEHDNTKIVIARDM